jgi:hypothetical protein
MADHSFSETPKPTPKRERKDRTGDYPNVPESPTEPGRELEVRLKAPGWQGANVIGIFILLLLCSGCFVLPIGGLVQGGGLSASGTGLGWLGLGVVLLGLWAYLVWLLVQQFRQTALGKPLVELSAHPLRPGVAYQLLFRWADVPPLDNLSVRLVCTEEVNYQQGTDTRTESAIVFSDSLWVLGGEDTDGEMSLPAAVRCPLPVPGGAMHSFHAPDNKVKWAIQVIGQFERWGAFDHQFPVTVYPPESSKAKS